MPFFSRLQTAPRLLSAMPPWMVTPRVDLAQSPGSINTTSASGYVLWNQTASLKALPSKHSPKSTSRTQPPNSAQRTRTKPMKMTSCLIKFWTPWSAPQSVTKKGQSQHFKSSALPTPSTRKNSSSTGLKNSTNSGVEISGSGNATQSPFT